MRLTITKSRRDSGSLLWQTDVNWIVQECFAQHHKA
jgi:hypothetical protein